MKMQSKILLGMFMLFLVGTSLVSALTIKEVIMNPREVAPGDTMTVEIIVDNDKDFDIKEVSVTLDLSMVPFAPADSSSEVSFDEIEEKDSETARFKLRALSDAESGIYKIPVVITYLEENENETKTKTSIISAVINSKPILGVVLEDGLLLKGKENEISITIINKGLSEVKFLEIEIGSSTSYDILSAKNVYIGSIDSDDFDNADFSVYFKKEIPTSLNIPVSISYTDSMNNQFTDSFDVPVKVYSRKRAIELGLLEESKTRLYIGIGIGLIIVYIVYKKIKKARLKKKKAMERN